MRHDPIDWDRVRSDVIRRGITEACQIHGIHRSTWYRRVKSGFSREAFDSAREVLEATILEISRERPRWGCDRISYFLALEGKKVSSPTVQKILVAHGLGRRRSRIDRAETLPPPPEISV